MRVEGGLDALLERGARMDAQPRLAGRAQDDQARQAEGGEEGREGQKPPRKAAAPKAERVKPAAKPAPKKGPSRTGPSKRGA